MTDDFSINDVSRKKTNKKDAVDSGLDDLRGIDVGETAWALDEETKPEKKEQAGKSTDEMPVFPPMPGFGDDDEPPKPSSLDILRLLRGVWGRRNLVITIAIAGTMLFLSLAFTLLHHKWEANVVMLKKEKLDQFQISASGAPFKQQVYSMKTMLDTLKLPSILIETITKTGIDVTPRGLSAAIDLHLGKESNIFTISVTWDDAKKAATIANTLADEFMKSNISMRREDAMQIYDYYSAQLTRAESSYKEVYENLLKFQNEYGVINFDSQTSVLLGKVAELDIQYRTIKAELDVAEKTYASSMETYEKTTPMVVGQTIYRNPLKTKLDELEWQLKQARGRYTDKNPKVTELLEQVNSLKKYIADGNDENTPEEHMKVNPLKHDLQMKLLELEDQIKLKKALADSTKNSIDQINSKLTTMTEKQKEYFQLVAEKDSMAGVIENLRNRVEESRVIMLSGNGDFEIVERARLPDEPQSSGRKIVVVAGFILSGGAGLFLALILEFFSPIVRTRKEVIGITQVENVFEFQHVPYREQDVIDISHPDENIAVLFRRMINDLYSHVSKEDMQSVAFVSAGRESGRSLIITNFAQAHSLKDRRCLLVDADIGRDCGTNLAEYFELEKRTDDLVSVLKNQSKINATILKTENPKVLILPNFQRDSEEKHLELLLGSRRMNDLITALTKFQGSVFYDLPPLIKSETAFEATAAIGKVILVVRSGICHKREIQHIVERMKLSNVEIIAVVITDVPAELMSTNLQFSEKPLKPKKK